MNKTIIKSIVKKDFNMMLQSKRTWIPMLVVSLLLCIILPISISYVGTYTNSISVSDSQSIQQTTDTLIQHLPNGPVKDELLHLTTLGQRFVFFFANYMLISLFIMVTVINSMATSTSSFVREKERGTLETLLFSPINIKDLFIAKVLASFLPSIILTYAAFVVSCTIINLMVHPVYHILFMFNIMWLILMIWVVPSLVFFNILLNVLISARMKTYQEAQQLGGLIILPFVGLVVSQTTGLFLISPILLLIAGLVLLVIDFLLLLFITKRNQRNSLFENQIH